MRVPVTGSDANGSILLKGRDRIIAYWTPPSSGSSGAPGGSPPSSGGSPPPPGATPTPTPTPPAPPATVTVLVDATATASFIEGPVDDLKPSAVLDNGFGDPTIVISDDGANKSWASRGLHLKTFSTANCSWIPPTQTSYGYTVPGKWMIQLPLDVNLSASITAQGTFFSFNGAGNIRAQLGGISTTGDTRGVKITRAGAPPVKPKTDSSFNWSTDEWEDIVNGQWVGHGHSRYSWNKPYDSNWMVTEPVTQTFQRDLIGDWSTTTTLTGTWTPEGNVDKPMGSEQIMPTGSPYKDGETPGWKGSSSGTKPHKVTLKIKDPDKNLSAEATYELTLHDEFEKIGSPEAVLPSSGEKFTTYAWLWGSDSNVNGKLMIIEGEGTDPNNVPDESGITISQGRATTSGLTAVGGVDFNLVKDLIGVNASVEFSYSVTNELGRGFPLGSNLKTGEHAAPVAYWTYNKYRQKLRQWESSGVNKETYTEYNVPTGDGIQWRVWDTTKTQDPVPGTPVYPK